MIPRRAHIRRLDELIGGFPIVGLIGPRQVGKTTLARQWAEKSGSGYTWFDLENPRDAARLTDPLLALEGLRGLVIIDEVQREPSLFPVLRHLVDRPESTARFILLGSASPALIRQSSESLAGRIAYHRLDGLSLDEVAPGEAESLWLRGGFPRSFLAPSEPASSEWRRQFLTTFVERDLPQLGYAYPAPTIRRFLSMLAHVHGQTLNYSELGRALGASDAVARRYLDALADALVVKLLPPWHANLAKRQVRSPKVYLADEGILHTLLGIEDTDSLLGHPKVGASWEGFALKEIVRVVGARDEEVFFWATHAGAELDLLIRRGSRSLGFELKRSSAPRTTRSMHSARESLELEELIVVFPGEEAFPLADGIRAVGLRALESELS